MEQSTEPSKESLVAGGTTSDQTLFGTLTQHLASMDVEFKKLQEQGLDDKPEMFQEACEELLRMYEVSRLKAEKDIQRYREAILFERARQRMCSLHASLLLGVIKSFVNKNLKKQGLREQHQEHKVGPNGEGDPVRAGRISEEEAKLNLCACACQDMEDVADCECICHAGKPCKTDGCRVCTLWQKYKTLPEGAIIIRARKEILRQPAPARPEPPPVAVLPITPVKEKPPAESVPAPVALAAAKAPKATKKPRKKAKKRKASKRKK